MKRYFISTLFVFLSCNVFAQDAKQVCNELKPVVMDLQKQSPIDVDYMTKLIGVQAIYAVNRCLLNYNYTINSESFLNEMMQTNNQTKEQNVSFLQTQDGLNTMQSVFDGIAKNAANAYFKPFINIKGVTITYSYSFDNADIPSVVATVMENK
ncbi:hypothetical protein AN214_00038 [Pseudoalteromonas sp. P1-9]|uniref:hypothetical protein n=1 Tax=Pseudoalteromonas sp. P1-9 TaxID=1710354 RepID=UPI0006D5F71B|nr:hypothetical protein [Pseudoalteromonas sp. P1-9]KPV98277.1 hypothetical protein AN214_00038 [Pseudoalteromonas sp. P1-9]